MGCVASTQAIKEEELPDAIPKYKSLVETRIDLLDGEPELTSKEDNYTSDEALMTIIRKIGTSNKGDTFQVDTMEDTLFHGLQIHPAKPGFGVKSRLEDLLYLHYESNDTPLAFAIKNVPKGLNYFLILSPKPVRNGQNPVKFQGPANSKDMYFYANVVFDLKAKVCNIHVAGQGKGDAPLYTMKQLNKKVWIIKKKQVVCAAVQQVRGMAKLSCFRALFCAGTDPAMMSLLVAIIDCFLETAKSQFWKFYDGKAKEDGIDWPPLDPQIEEKLFGHEFRLF